MTVTDVDAPKGRIVAEDIAQVRERTHIDDVVRDYVTLKTGGVGSLKGLCPFHDERTPSFHVRPQVGLWHCFGCSEGGDAISFVQKIDGLSFTEAVEHLASKAGITLRYEEATGQRRPGEDPRRRQRLLDAHTAAAAFYQEQILSPEARAARQFLADRGFDRAAAERFGVGYAPKGWDHLLRHLRGEGFTDAELVTAGLMSEGQRGIYDRFRGRLVWPIRDLTGAVIGFGARRLYDEDQGPKYLNTPETPIYHKSQVLYGIDLAKRDIAKTKRIVIVEGYTDVMAAHLAGETTAVATCGTAFGPDHARIARRLLGDGANIAALTSSNTGEVIFTFDGDSAGQKAALRAFGEDQRFSAQTYVAVAPGGMDPCEVRINQGAQGVRDLINSRRPLFEFVIRTVIDGHDLSTAEGRVRALRTAAPIVASIRDAALRPEYADQLASWLGMDPDTVRRAVAQAEGAPLPAVTTTRRPQQDDEVAEERLHPVPDLSDPTVQNEKKAVEVMVQHPHEAADAGYEDLSAEVFTASAYRAVAEVIDKLGGLRAVPYDQPGEWVERLRAGVPDELTSLVTECAVVDLPDDDDQLALYIECVRNDVLGDALARQIAEDTLRMSQIGPDDPAYWEALNRLADLHRRRELLGAG